ncbi:MAG: hypothetical protein NC123_04305 [Butyrivibrio sp.]|nr:hypothetical protein [Acetatifactor muris]MCM1558750.1 hypothetical protein [Butyrivibrio sp.]
MGKERRLYYLKAVAVVFIILTLAAAGAVVYQVRRADKQAGGYMSVNGEYMMRLDGDGTFSLGWLPSSFLEIDNPDVLNCYRWDGDMLVLEYGNSEGVLYFQKEDDTLVFQKAQSVLPEDPHHSFRRLIDGITFKKME